MTIKELIEIAEYKAYNDYHIHAGMERKVVTKEWEKEDKKRTYIKIYCYSLGGKNYKGKYECGYLDNVTGAYVPGEINLAE